MASTDPLRLAARSAYALARLEDAEQADAIEKRRRAWSNTDRAGRLAVAVDLAREAIGPEHADRIAWDCPARIPQLTGTPRGRHPGLPSALRFYVLPPTREADGPARLVIGHDIDAGAPVPYMLDDGTTADVATLADVGRIIEDYTRNDHDTEGDDTP